MPALVKKSKKGEGSGGGGDGVDEEIVKQEEKSVSPQKKKERAVFKGNKAGTGRDVVNIKTDNPEALKAQEERKTAGATGTYSSELRAFRHQIMSVLGSNLSDEEMSEKLGVTYRRFSGQKTKVIEQIKDEFGSSNIDVFVAYYLKQNAIGCELEKVCEYLQKKERWRDYLAAAKLLSNINQIIMDQAMEMGVVKRQAQEVHVVGSQDVSSLSVREISVELNKEMGGLKAMLREIAVSGKGIQALKNLGLTSGSKAISEKISKDGICILDPEPSTK